MGDILGDGVGGWMFTQITYAIRRRRLVLLMHVLSNGCRNDEETGAE